MKVLLVNGSPHKEGCTYTALSEVAAMLIAFMNNISLSFTIYKQAGGLYPPAIVLKEWFSSFS